jgi:hypothetical protein
LEELNKVLVVGNGESRKNIQLKNFNYSVIGCNALHRDFTVNHLVCCDRRMADEAVNNPNMKNSLIYVREDWFHYFRKILKNKNIQHLPPIPFVGELKKDQPEHWGSGCYAVLLAAHLKFQEIQLLGFDLYPIKDRINNVYKGTQNYSKIDSQGVDYSYWVYQIAQVFRYYSDSKFIIFNVLDWKIPQEWVLPNVEFKNIEQLNVDL